MTADAVQAWLGSDEADEWRRTAARAPIRHPGARSGMLAAIIAAPGADGPARLAHIRNVKPEHDPCGRPPLERAR